MSSRLRLCLVGIAAAAWPAGCEKPNEYVAPPPPSVTVALPVQQEVTDYLNFTGRTVAVAEVDLVARVEGTLETVHFEDGALVNEGDVLFTIEQDEYEAQLRVATAAVEEADADLALAEATLKRKVKAAQTQAVSELDVLQAQAQRDGAEARLLSARAHRDRVELDLTWTEIVAPMSGRISRRYVDPGNLVGRGERTRLATIVQYSPIYAEFDINERDLLTLVANKKASGEAGDAAEDEDTRLEELRRVKLELGRVVDDGFPLSGALFYADPEVDAGTGTLLIRGILDNEPPFDLVPGLFVKVRTVLGVREALLVPELALGTDQGGRYVLTVGDDDVVTQQRVRTGVTLDGMVVIEEGLDPEDRVIVNGLLRARPGSEVTPTTAGTPAATDT